MIKVERKGAVRSLMPVYEDNYRLMHQLVPALATIRVPTTLILADDPLITLSLLDCAPYTSVIELTHRFGVRDERLLRDLEMRLRVYHDARLLEVIAYQGHGRFAPIYPYPNQAMLSPFEKRLVNHFFGEWLRACRSNGHRFYYHPGLYASFQL